MLMAVMLMAARHWLVTTIRPADGGLMMMVMGFVVKQRSCSPEGIRSAVTWSDGLVGLYGAGL